MDYPVILLERITRFGNRWPGTARSGVTDVIEESWRDEHGLVIDLAWYTWPHLA